MNESVISGTLLIAVGIIDMFYAIKFLTNPTFAMKYIKESPKAWLWGKLFGVEKAIKVTRKIFAPLGIVLGILLITVGIVMLVN